MKVAFKPPLNALKVHDTLRDAFSLPEHTAIRGLTEIKQSSLLDVLGRDMTVKSDGQLDLEKIRQHTGILALPDAECLTKFWNRLAASSATQRALVPFVATSNFYSASQWWHCRNAESSCVTVQHKIVTPRIKSRGKGEFGNAEDSDICIFRSFLQNQNIRAHIRFLPSFGPPQTLARICGLGVVWVDAEETPTDVGLWARLWAGVVVTGFDHW